METVNKAKRPSIKGKKIFVKYISDKGLIPNYIKKLKQSNSKKTNNPIKACKELEQTFLQRLYTKVKQVHEKMLVIQGNENENQMRYHHTCENGCHQKDEISNGAQMWRQGNTHELLVGM